MRRILIAMTMLLCISVDILAYGIYTDAARTAAVLESTRKSKKVMDGFLERQGLLTGSHVLTIDQINDVNMFQREFNEYIDTIRNVISIAAQIYGLYYETDRCLDYMGQITKVINDNPTNALALSLSVNRNHIYGDVIERTTDVLNDIYSVCFSKSKMTVKERWQVVGGIRPKMRNMNRELRKLCLMIKFTTLGDVWREITGNAERYRIRSRVEIAQDCMTAWKHNL